MFDEDFLTLSCGLRVTELFSLWSHGHKICSKWSWSQRNNINERTYTVLCQLAGCTQRCLVALALGTSPVLLYHCNTHTADIACDPMEGGDT